MTRSVVHGADAIESEPQADSVALHASRIGALLEALSLTPTPCLSQGPLVSGALYPELAPSKSGLTKTSYARIDHLRSIDKRRIRRVFGRVAKAELAAVDQGLLLFLGLES